MTENTETQNLDIGAVRTQALGLISIHGLKRSKVAREAGISDSALSRFLADSYAGDNDAVASKLTAWIDTRLKRDKLPHALVRAHGFVSTSVAKRVAQALDHAQGMVDLVTVVGEPGVGKTATLNHFRQSGANAWLLTLSPDLAGPVPMLEELGAAVGLTVSGGAAGMRRQILARIRGTAGLIIVDECQHADLKTLETLRSIHDAAQIGMAWCGNPGLLVKIARLPQAHSRLGRRIILDKPTRADVALVAGRFGIGKGDGLDFLTSISQCPGGLRAVVKTLRLGLMEAAGADEPLGPHHLTAAWSELALEDAA